MIYLIKNIINYYINIICYLFVTVLLSDNYNRQGYDQFVPNKG